MTNNRLNNFSIDNFRVFSEKTEFNIKPLTILVGPNNSGKSTLIKSLELLTPDLLTLDFNKTKLNSFQSSLPFNRTEQSNLIDYYFNLTLPYLKDEYELILSYGNNNHPGESVSIRRIQIRNKSLNKIVFFVASKSDLCAGDWVIGFDFVQVFEEILEYKFSKKEGKVPIYNKDDSFNSFIDLSKTPETASDNLFAILKKIKGKKEELFTIIDDNGQEIQLSNSPLDPLENLDYLKTDEKNLFLSPYNPGADGDLNIFKLSGIVNYAFGFIKNNLLHYQKSEIENLFDRKINKSIGGVTPNTFWELLFGVVFQKSISELERNINSSLRAINHLPIDSRTSHERVHIINNSFFAKNLSKYNDGIHSPEKAFLDFSLNEILEIDGTIKIIPFEGDAISVKIKNGKKEISFSDLGFGYSQILTILIYIINIAIESYDKEFSEYLDSPHYSDRIIIIEEPEANLHPNFQSKLADIFVEAQKRFNIRFIIETHSEYFIRKLQYLTAKQKLTPNDTVIYYFNNPLELKKGEKQIKKINIRKDGMINEDFGSGFFDEASNLTFDLLQIHNLN